MSYKIDILHTINERKFSRLIITFNKKKINNNHSLNDAVCS